MVWAMSKKEYDMSGVILGSVDLRHGNSIITGPHLHRRT